MDAINNYLLLVLKPLLNYLSIVITNTIDIITDWRYIILIIIASFVSAYFIDQYDYRRGLRFR